MVLLLVLLCRSCPSIIHRPAFIILKAKSCIHIVDSCWRSARSRRCWPRTLWWWSLTSAGCTASCSRSTPSRTTSSRRRRPRAVCGAEKGGWQCCNKQGNFMHVYLLLNNRALNDVCCVIDVYMHNFAGNRYLEMMWCTCPVWLPAMWVTCGASLAINRLEMQWCYVEAFLVPTVVCCCNPPFWSRHWINSWDWASIPVNCFCFFALRRSWFFTVDIESCVPEWI